MAPNEYTRISSALQVSHLYPGSELDMLRCLIVFILQFKQLYSYAAKISPNCITILLLYYLIDILSIVLTKLVDQQYRQPLAHASFGKQEQQCESWDQMDRLDLRLACLVGRQQLQSVDRLF